MINAMIEEITGQGLPETSEPIKLPVMATNQNLKNQVKTHLLLFQGWCFSISGRWR